MVKTGKKDIEKTKNEIPAILGYGIPKLQKWGGVLYAMLCGGAQSRRQWQWVM